MKPAGGTSPMCSRPLAWNRRQRGGTEEGVSENELESIGRHGPLHGGTVDSARISSVSRALRHQTGAPRSVNAGLPAPNESWILQVGRNLIDPWAAFPRSSSYLIHDRATVFREPFRQLLRSAQVEGLRLPARSPNLNAFAERFVRTIRQGCLDRMVFFGVTALRRAVEEFVIHYNQERNHQGLADQLIRREVPGFPVGGNICQRKRLGGLLNYYFREAAARANLNIWTLRGQLKSNLTTAALWQ